MLAVGTFGNMGKQVKAGRLARSLCNYAVRNNMCGRLLLQRILLESWRGQGARDEYP